MGENIGTIWKRWPGFNDDVNIDHEYFGLESELFSHLKRIELH